MGWFTRKPNPMTARTRELNAEIAALEFEILQLNEAVDFSDPRQIQTVLEETRSMPADFFLRPEEELVGPIPTEPERDCPGLYNDQGLRKFDLAGWCRRLKRSEQQPTPTKNEQLVTLIAAGRHHGHTALRKDTRLARNRFILLALVLLAVLWSILSLLIPQL